MESQLSTCEAIAIIGPLIHEVRLLKGQNCGLKQQYESLQRESSRRDAIIDEQGRLLRSANFDSTVVSVRSLQRDATHAQEAPSGEATTKKLEAQVVIKDEKQHSRT